MTSEIVPPPRRRRARVGAALVASIIGIADASMASAGELPRSMCRQRDVLNFAAAKFISQDPYADLVRNSVTEMPTAYPDTVSCSAYIRITRYDAARSGLLPEVSLLLRSFTVKRLDHGFEVTVPR